MMIIRVLLFLTSFVTALVAGYKEGDNLQSVDEIFSSQMDAMIMPSVTIPDNNQFNILLIGVDDMHQPDANLESIWLAAHVENSSNIALIPVFPSPDDLAQNLTLTQSFNLDGGKPGCNEKDQFLVEGVSHQRYNYICKTDRCYRRSWNQWSTTEWRSGRWQHYTLGK